MKQAKPEMGAKITCPYCGKPGRVLRIFNDSVDVEHVVEKRKFIGKVSGEEMEIECFVDGCSRDGKIGSAHHFKPVAEEDY